MRETGRSNEDPVNRWLPLYQGLGQKGRSPWVKPKTAHPGLLFEKFCDVWAGQDSWKPESPKRGEERRNIASLPKSPNTAARTQ